MAPDLLDLSKSFARHLRAERKAERTVTLYTMSARMFAEWLTAEGRPPTLDQLTRPNVRDWLAHLSTVNARETVRTRHRGLFRFCRWLVLEDEIDHNPMQGLAPPAPKPTPVPILTDEQLAALLKSCNGRTLADRRDAAVFRVLLDTGVRVSELCAMTLQTVDLDNGMAIVRGKGDKVRPVYFGARTVAALDRYLRTRATSRHAHLDALFLTQRGALTPDGARDMIRRRGERVGIAHLHPHMFRHTFAHDFLMAGGQGPDLKRLAGWSSDSMLERYGSSGADTRAREAARRMRRGDRV